MSKILPELSETEISGLFLASGVTIIVILSSWNSKEVTATAIRDSICTGGFISSCVTKLSNGEIYRTSELVLKGESVTYLKRK